MSEKLWEITMSKNPRGMIKKHPRETTLLVEAERCDVEDGALVLGGGTIGLPTIVIAPGQWLRVERGEGSRE